MAAGSIGTLVIEGYAPVPLMMALKYAMPAQAELDLAKLNCHPLYISSCLRENGVCARLSILVGQALPLFGKGMAGK